MATKRKIVEDAARALGRLTPIQKAKVDRMLDTAIGFLRTNPSAFEVGKHFLELEIDWTTNQGDYGIPFTTFDSLIDSRGEIGGRRRRMRGYLKSFYRTFKSEPNEQMQRVSDKYARVLASVYGSRSRRVSSKAAGQAIQLAVDRKFNAEVLEHMLRGSEGIFTDEAEISEYLRLDSYSLIRTSLAVTQVVEAVYLEHTGEPDFVGRRDDELVIIEVEHTARSEDVGQVLGFLREAQAGVNDHGYLMMFDRAPALLREAEPKRFQATSVSACMVAQAYQFSAYFAATGLPLYFYRITGGGALVGPLNMQTTSLADWETFTLDQVADMATEA